MTQTPVQLSPEAIGAIGAIGAIEALVGRRVRRDISRLVHAARGNLLQAAASLASTPRPSVGLVTGFFIRHGEPPSAETDGLNGVAHLAAGLTAAGVPVKVITDAPCAKAVWAVLQALPQRVELEVVDVSAQSVRALRDRLERQRDPLSHLIAVERVAPGTDGRPHREHGWDMSAETAPLHLLFQEPGWARPWTTIGVGDGGNEIGMGSLPRELVTADIPNGELIAAQTPCDHLIVSGVSNWGAYALLAAIACLRPDLSARLLAHFTESNEEAFLAAAVEIGQAVDDGGKERPAGLSMSVDRLPLHEHCTVLRQIRRLCAVAPP